MKCCNTLNIITNYRGFVNVGMYSNSANIFKLTILNRVYRALAVWRREAPRRKRVRVTYPASVNIAPSGRYERGEAWMCYWISTATRPDAHKPLALVNKCR